MKTYAKNTSLLAAATAILDAEQPCTLRQLFYRLISAGHMDNTPAGYQRLGTLMVRAREEGIVSRRWIVDHVRDTLKPNSWSGLEDFSDTVSRAYRKNYWSNMSAYVCVFVEKDAIAGTIQPVTYANDVALHVCRGYSSVSFAGEIADQWAEIQKPIFAYYLGDHDPSGYDLERDLREKLQRYSGRYVYDFEKYGHLGESDISNAVMWKRLGVRPADFEEFKLIKLPVKESDNRAAAFIEKYGNAGAEIDAIPPSELRRRVESAIDEHIDTEQWNALILVEDAERATVRTMLASLGKQSESSLNLDAGVAR
ncbi:MAG: hypothetical protein JWM11_6395 [Planctomycetaceae bacterium]|nr:hypothetical protein [Planctomycetaceae bacterium]